MTNEEFLELAKRTVKDYTTETSGFVNKSV